MKIWIFDISSYRTAVISIHIIITICIIRDWNHHQEPLDFSKCQESLREVSKSTERVVGWIKVPMIHSQKYNGKQRDEAQASNHHLQTRNEKQLLEVLQKWILHFHLLKFLHQKWLLEKGMSHQITGLITRTSVLLSELCCLGLLCQQSWVMCSLSRVPSAPHWGDNNTPTCTASGCQEGHTPGIPNPHGAVLTALGPRLCLVWWEAGLCSPSRDLQAQDRPWKTQLPASFKGRLVLRSTAAGISSALPWQGSPCSVQRQKIQHPHGAQCPPQTATSNVANKHNHHILIAILRAPSSFCSQGHKLLKLVWSESMIQHENSFFTQSPGVTPRCTIEGG